MNKLYKVKVGDVIEVEKKRFIILVHKSGRGKGKQYSLKRWKTICKYCNQEIQ